MSRAPFAPTLYEPAPYSATGGPRGEDGHGGAPGLWLVTFVDLTALLIAFLVMLFAMSEIDGESWRALRESLGEASVSPPEVTVVQSEEISGLEPVRTIPGLDLDYLAGVLRRGLDEVEPLGGATVLRRADRLVVAVPGPLLFAPGGTALHDEGRRAAVALADMLSHLDNRIEVVGHADPTAPQAAYASNWELSLDRAVAVAGLIEQAGYDKPVLARGLGESRFATLTPGAPDGERRALARRVDIVIHGDQGERDK